MTTPFDTIYPQFLSQVTDYELATMDEIALEENLQLWLLGAIGFFSNCKHDLSDFDLVTQQFNSDLNHMEKQILAKFMVIVYLDTHLIKDSLYKEKLNSKDYRSYSPAALMKTLLEVKTKINSEANTLMSRYSYNIHRLKDFFK